MCWSVRCRCGARLDVDLSRRRPAAAKSSRYFSGSTIIRCTSTASLVAARMAFTTGGPDGDVRHEAAVHHVDVDPVGAGGLDGAHLFREAAEIGRRGSRAR